MSRRSGHWPGGEPDDFGLRGIVMSKCTRLANVESIYDSGRK